VSEWLPLLGSLVAGGVLGLAFFRALWATIARLPERRHPGLWLLGSLLLRFGLALGVFYLLARYGGWQHLLGAAVGFTLVRLWLVRRGVPPGRNKESAT
jgi:F1F0 ATPase subunit 2